MKPIEKEQFCELVRAQEISMYRYALGMLRNPQDAEDAVQEAILKAYTHLAQLKDPERFKSWMMSILANGVRTMLSKRSRMEVSGDVECYERTAPETDRELWRLVMGLPQEYRDVVILYYYEGFRTREIAASLRLSEGTVKSRLSRARGRLKTALEEG